MKIFRALVPVWLLLLSLHTATAAGEEPVYECTVVDFTRIADEPAPAFEALNSSPTFVIVDGGTALKLHGKDKDGKEFELNFGVRIRRTWTLALQDPLTAIVGLVMVDPKVAKAMGARPSRRA